MGTLLSAPNFFTASPMFFAPARLAGAVPCMKSSSPPIKALLASAPCKIAPERSSSWMRTAASIWPTLFMLKAAWP